MDNKKTTKQQFARLVRFMEENPEVARGSKFVARESVTSLWGTIKDSLNSLGPPTRSVAAWQKVWTDKRLQLRRKLQHNNNELRATGGGPNTLHSFNGQEEAIIRLLSLERAVTHNGAVFGTQSSPSTSAAGVRQAAVPSDEPPTEEPGAIEDEPMPDNPAREDEAGRGQSTPRGRGRATRRNFRKALLEKQTDDLCKIKRHVSDCARYARKSYDLHQKRFALETKRFQLQEEKFRFKKQMQLEKQKHKSQQLQYQLQLLQYKKQKLDFEMGRTSGPPMTGSTSTNDENEEMGEDDSDENL